VVGTDVPWPPREDSDPNVELEEDTVYAIAIETLVQQHQAKLNQLADRQRMARAARAGRRDETNERRNVRRWWRVAPADVTTGG
jgi:hypothetical protein